MRVHVIEDDPGLAEIIADELGDAGHTVVTSPDGAAALERLAAGAVPDSDLPEAIVLDLLMPHMDGQRFRIQQLADPRLAPIPTLVMTGRPIDERTRASLPGVAVLRKPFGLDILLALLEEVVRPRRLVKECACGRAYDSAGWRARPFVAEMDNGREVGERLELRQCECRSTIAWQVGPHALSIPAIAVKPPGTR